MPHPTYCYGKKNIALSGQLVKNDQMIIVYYALVFYLLVILIEPFSRKVEIRKQVPQQSPETIRREL